MTDVMPLQQGTSGADLEAKYREASGSYYFTGVQALVRAPVDQMRTDRLAGKKTATFISGYQGSPLGGYDREIINHKQLLDPWNIVHTPGLNGGTRQPGLDHLSQAELRRRSRHLVRQVAGHRSRR